MVYKNPIPDVDSPASKPIGIGRSTCECCSKSDLLVCGTSFTGLYCKKCLRLVISECKEAIREIEKHETGKERRVPTKNKGSKAELAELEKKKNDALAKLLSADFTNI